MRVERKENEGHVYGKKPGGCQPDIETSGKEDIQKKGR